MVCALFPCLIVAEGVYGVPHAVNAVRKADFSLNKYAKKWFLCKTRTLDPVLLSFLKLAIAKQFEVSIMRPIDTEHGELSR
ncbi:hypothetical protein A1OU_05280 [Enterovibrio norvegicus]|nr:hypothetical protein A1OU_05280 [Enterovibrio norvegicus]